MDVQRILDILRAVKLELYRKRVVAVVVFMLITSGVLAFGYVVPKQYTSEAVLYADQSDILQPLLSGQAEVTQIDRVNEAREMLQSRSFLEQVALDTGLLTGGEADQQQNNIISSLRDRVRMRVTNGNFIELRYTSDNPDESFEVLSTVLDRFVERTIAKKRAESQGAFEFIDSQVKAYQRQLEEADEKLKEFKANNQDGTEGSVLARIEGLRQNIETLKLEIQQSESEVKLTREQLETEEPVRRITIDPGRSSDERRLANAYQELHSLLLRYHEKHPDVISIRAQIEDLKDQVANQDDSSRQGQITEVMENPVYENLKIQLADSTTRLAVQRNRLASMKRLLEEAFERSERVAENQAELSELTRDYDVTRGVYEDMLQRREKARLSMTLDVQGEGVSYKIQEPATFPTRWDGLQLYEIGLAGPFLGSGMVLGLLTMLVMFDQRIRSPRALSLTLPNTIPVLTTIPHYRGTWKDRLLRKDTLLLLFVLTLFLLVYLLILLFSVMGVTPDQLINRITELTGLGGS